MYINQGSLMIMPGESPHDVSCLQKHQDILFKAVIHSVPKSEHESEHMPFLGSHRRKGTQERSPIPFTIPAGYPVVVPGARCFLVTAI